MAPATLWLVELPGGYPLFRQRILAYPARPASPLPRSSSVPGSGTKGSSGGSSEGQMARLSNPASGVPPELVTVATSVAAPVAGLRVKICWGRYQCCLQDR